MRSLKLAAVVVLAFSAGGVLPSIHTVYAQPGPGPVRSVLLDTQSASGAAGQFDASSYTYLTFYLQSNGTTSSGVVTLEEAESGTPAGGQYTGTWSTITTVNASSFTGGAQLAYHVQGSAFSHVRARISTVIGGGGTVTVVLRGK